MTLRRQPPTIGHFLAIISVTKTVRPDLIGVAAIFQTGHGVKVTGQMMCLPAVLFQYLWCSAMLLLQPHSAVL